jgi:hypothetical protein
MKQINNLQQLVAAVLADVKQAQSIAFKCNDDPKNVMGEAWLQANNPTIKFESPDAQILGFVWTNTRRVIKGEQTSEFIVRSVKMSAAERKTAPKVKMHDACGNPLPKRNNLYTSITFTSTNCQEFIEEQLEGEGNIDFDKIEFGNNKNAGENEGDEQLEIVNSDEPKTPSAGGATASLTDIECFEIREIAKTLGKVAGEKLSDAQARRLIRNGTAKIENGDIFTGKSLTLSNTVKHVKKPKKVVSSKNDSAIDMFGGV